MQFVSDSPTPYPDYLQLKFEQFELLGRSIAGVETVLAIPQWNLCFDSGRAPHFAVPQDYLALTHWHLDHAGGLASYLGLRHLNGLKPLNIITPDTKLPLAEKFLEQLKLISESALRYQLYPASRSYHLKPGLSLRPLANDHCVDSTAYCVWRETRCLKPDFVGKPASDLIAAKAQGLAIEARSEHPYFAVSGDTRGEFLAGPARQARYLLAECSFFDDGTNYEKIRAYGHTHILDWQRYAEQIESEWVIMSHTSQRYSKSEIASACERFLPKSLLARLLIFR